MDLIITSGHRTGSRWLHYLLADLYGKEVSPEVDGFKIKSRESLIRRYFSENRIVKFHRATQNMIFKNLDGEYFVIAILRNPRDRAVSYAFHNRYHNKNKRFKQRQLPSDLEAVKYTVLKDRNFKLEERQHLEMMEPGYSTRNKVRFDKNYIWTTYEWMKENTLREIQSIITFIETEPKKRPEQIVVDHSFKSKSGRKPGEEDRKDLWRRKGVVNDWENWFNEEMLEASKKDYLEYEAKVNNEIRSSYLTREFEKITW